MKPCFRAADILLPSSGVQLDKWAVIACDQHTSQPDYWKQTEHIVQDAASTLHMIYPEVYLGKEDGKEEQKNRITEICRCMERYVREGIVTEQVVDGFVLVVRKTVAGERVGLVGALDLEQYSYAPDTRLPVRATEGTISERIPPRMKVREEAVLEVPHVMVLINDCKKSLVEWLYGKKEELPKLYDTDLMQGGGHVCGYKVEGSVAKETEKRICNLQKQAKDLLLVVGDGNHSLAAAKESWNRKKELLEESERETHPARYALVELVNVYSPALVFEPIHRVLYGVSGQTLFRQFQEYLAENNIPWAPGKDIIFAGQEGIELVGRNRELPVAVLQKFLDEYLELHSEVQADYVHGKKEVCKIAGQDGNCGILLQAMDKKDLFPAVRAGGVLPRKTFSMGEACEKRYYMECHRIKG